MDSSGEHPRRHIACGICRRRKLKCDGLKPTCSTCQRLGQVCEYTEVVRKAGPKRGYVRSLETRLAQLEKLLNEYHLDSNDSSLNSTSSEELVALNIDEPLPPSELVKELTEHFFNTFNTIIPVVDRKRYTITMGFEPTRGPPPFLQYAIMATAAADATQYRALKPVLYQRARKYISRAEIFRSGDNAPSVAYIQALGLLAHLETREGLFPQAWVAVGKAHRACTMLSLHLMDAEKWQEPGQDMPDIAEARRAVWFAFFCDRAGSIATSLPAIFKVDDLLLKLPLDDEAFLQGNYETDTMALDQLLAQPTAIAKFPNARLALMVALCETNVSILELGKFPKLKFLSAPKEWFNHYQRWDGILAQLTSSLPPVPPVPASEDVNNKVLLAQKSRRTSHVQLHLWAQVGVLVLCRSGLYGIQALPVLLPLFNAGKLLQRALMGMLEIMLITRNPHDITIIGAHPLHPVLLFALCVLILALSEHGLVTLDSFRAPLEYIDETLSSLSGVMPVAAKLSVFLSKALPSLNLNKVDKVRRVEDVIAGTGVHLSLPNFFDRWVETAGVSSQNVDSQDPSMVRRFASPPSQPVAGSSNTGAIGRPRAESVTSATSGSSPGSVNQRSPPVTKPSPNDMLVFGDFASTVDNVKLRETEQNVGERYDKRSPRDRRSSHVRGGFSDLVDTPSSNGHGGRTNGSETGSMVDATPPVIPRDPRNANRIRAERLDIPTLADDTLEILVNQHETRPPRPDINSNQLHLHPPGHNQHDKSPNSLQPDLTGLGSQISPQNMDEDPPTETPDEHLFDFDPPMYIPDSKQDPHLDGGAGLYGQGPWMDHHIFENELLGNNPIDGWPNDGI